MKTIKDISTTIVTVEVALIAICFSVWKMTENNVCIWAAIAITIAGKIFETIKKSTT